jgi:hypothetical protein
VGGIQPASHLSALSAANRAAIQKVFQYQIEGEREQTVVKAPDGKPVDLRELHHRTQDDPQIQYSLYCTAMTLWH